MSLLVGTLLGVYEVESLIAVGGMGEVYRARDTRLDRVVAIKVLASHVQGKRGVRERFHREARAVSRLTHPNICSLYDVGERDGMPYLVMEYVQGETLHSRLARGPLALEDVLLYAEQIVSALNHAHTHGIVHRDLKPANIMVTDGGVKMLDFGIAVLRLPEEVLARPGEPVPTVTDEDARPGTIPYMAPEQLEGRHTDARVDIFAFGAVLYEMATGMPVFQRQVVTGSALPDTVRSSEVPRFLDDLVSRCLERDPRERWQSASDLLHAIRWLRGGPVPVALAPRRFSPRSKAILVPVVAALMIAAVAFVVLRSPKQQSASNPPITFSIAAPEDTRFALSSAFMVLSPDGRSLAFVASSEGAEPMLWVRRLDSDAARPLPGTEEAVQPFWSSDSRQIAFFSRNDLKYIDPATGLLTTGLAGALGQSGAWNPTGIILFKPYNREILYRTDINGAAATPATALDASRGETRQNWPEFLPDGVHFLYSVFHGAAAEGNIRVGRLDSPASIDVGTTTSQAMYAPEGFLLFMRGSTLVAQRFDLRTLRLTGTPSPIAESVEYNPLSHRSAFSVSKTGVLAYRRFGATQLTWFDRSGGTIGRVGSPGYYRNPVITPDQRSVAVVRLDPQNGTKDIWTIDLASGAETRVTFGGHVDNPVWSADGEHLLYKTSGGFGRADVARGAAAGIEPAVIAPVGGDPFTTPLDWSPDGATILYEQFDDTTRRMRLWMLPLGQRGDARALAQSPFDEVQGRLSPDGRLVAYVASQSGKYDVFVRPVTGDASIQVSNAGGLEPQWRADGRELFFLAGDGSLASVTLSTSGAAPRFTTPQRLFQTRLSAVWNGAYNRNRYAVGAAGQRFLVNEPARQEAPITVVLNWTALVNRERHIP
jgi:eukaryotic-like serine/threonine-protein kinase